MQSVVYSLPVLCGLHVRWPPCSADATWPSFSIWARDPLLYAITMDVVPPSQRSRWAALNSLRTLSFSASAVLGGYLADLHGYVFSFDITVIALLASTVTILPAWLYFPRSEGAVAATVADCGASPTTASSFATTTAPSLVAPLFGDQARSLSLLADPHGPAAETSAEEVTGAKA
mmetsp:Transcript_55566/g.159821  ORF Transcript_55566/g.159821 Transcript_55566/m.159821 type:complete len:175 (-) Transcript_55566:123-647(-)